MLTLFSKNEDISKAAPIVGAKILELMSASKNEKVSIFDIAKVLKKSRGLGVRSIYYGVIFLYSLGIIDFDEPYVEFVNDKDK